MCMPMRPHIHVVYMYMCTYMCGHLYDQCFFLLLQLLPMLACVAWHSFRIGGHLVCGLCSALTKGLSRPMVCSLGGDSRCFMYLSHTIIFMGVYMSMYIPIIPL